MGGGYWEENGLCGDCIDGCPQVSGKIYEILTARPCVKEAKETENAQGGQPQGSGGKQRCHHWD